MKTASLFQFCGVVKVYRWKGYRSGKAGPMVFKGLAAIATELSDWLRANRDAIVSLNIAPEILGRGGLEHVATKSGLVDVASQVIVEITERGGPDALGLQAIIHGQRAGFKVALDDVTLVGGANLAVLARADFFAIKLDKSLIDKIARRGPVPEWSSRSRRS
jgi:sensor c-di-GMP phosphodiesterase-like protein